MTTWQTMTDREKIDVIKSLMSKGMGNKRIAKEIEGATTGMIAGFRHRHIRDSVDLPTTDGKSWPEMTRQEKYEAIKSMALDGHSEASIGRSIPDCNKNKIIGFRHNHMQDFNWPKKNRKAGFAFGNDTLFRYKNKKNLSINLGLDAPIVEFQTGEFAYDFSVKIPRLSVFFPKTKAASLPTCAGVPLLARRMNKECAWVLPDRNEDGELFVCGEPVAKQGKQWCPYHYNIVYVVKVVKKGERNENRT